MISPHPPIPISEHANERRWPVDFALCQHAPSLWERELQELDHVMKWRALPPVLPLPLQQLLQPVQEALDASHANPRMRHDVRRVLLVEMHRRRSPFWDWTAEEWFESLCSTAVAFAKRYPGAPTCRQQVLTVAYLLCGFTDFHKLGAFLRKTLADTTFGAARMEETIQRVVEGTRRWGLKRREDLALYSVVREALLLNRSPYLEDLTYDMLLLMRERTDTLAIKRALGTFSCALLALGLFKKRSQRCLFPQRRG